MPNSKNLLSRISNPLDIKMLSSAELKTLCEEIRVFFIENILKNGGHFSANLGVVELTVALLKVFDPKIDKLIWDVGHQSYIYKLLTDRKETFQTIRKFNGLSGFPKISESEYDHFGTGHSSTAISAILGMAEAALLNLDPRMHIAIVGDGSLTGGMSFEALNNLGKSNANVMVIVNDNQMGIDPNTGAFGQHLNEMRAHVDNFFTNLSLPYFGPYDGHNLQEVLAVLQDQKLIKGPRVVHLRTLKGKGYEPAEIEQTQWHSVSYVKVSPSTAIEQKLPNVKFQDIFGQELCVLADQYPDLVAITPAMPSGSNLTIMQKKWPARVFDVGIAEQHAVTFAAGMSLGGKISFCVIYSSFLQRAIDQLIHDVALQNIPIVLCIDRAGFVGEDGSTHHGVFDVPLLKCIPNLTIISPSNGTQLKAAMQWSCTFNSGPVAIRYPKGKIPLEIGNLQSNTFAYGKARFCTLGTKIAIISYGVLVSKVLELIWENDLTNDVCLLDLCFLKPLDIGAITGIFSKFDKIICLEESAGKGGINEEIKALAFDCDYNGKIKALSIPDEFSPHGTIEELYQIYGLDNTSILRLINDFLAQ